MTTASPKAFPLKCAVQQYQWGKVGESSEVAQLSLSSSDFKLKQDEPYAELWMGTHPKAPSVVKCDGGDVMLTEWLEKNPDMLGNNIRKQFGDRLPFLFKVLSVKQALSVQAHPNKAHAEQLRREKPDKYPDDNHKPEMAIALTQFEGLCGFRPLEEIVSFLKKIPEFRNVIGTDLSQEMISCVEVIDSSHGKQGRRSLKKCFTALMTCDLNIVQKNLCALTQSLHQDVKSGKDVSDRLGELMLRVNSHFPGDVGCFCIYFLNHMLLQPGEAIFLEANLPHAYLSGDCIECMSCSDNVVRAGLTAKFKDVSTLCEMLVYEPKASKERLFAPTMEPNDPYLSVYNPPVPDFAVSKIQVPKGVFQYSITSIDSASIVLTITGQGQGYCDGHTIDVRRGVVFFVAANESVNINIMSDGLLLFRAFCA